MIPFGITLRKEPKMIGILRELTIFMSYTGPVHVRRDTYLFTLEKNGTMTFLVCSITGQEFFSARLSLEKFLNIHAHISHS